MTRANRKTFEENISLEIKSNPKLFWQYIKSKTKSNPGVAPLYKTNNGEKILIEDNKEKAEILAEQFKSVFTIEKDGNMPKLPVHKHNQPLTDIYIT